MAALKHSLGRVAAVLAATALLVSGVAPVGAADVVPNFPHLSFTIQPSAAVGGSPFTLQPVVHDVDAGGSPRVGDPITIGIVPGTGTPGAVLTCNALTLVSDPSGNTSYTDCQIDKAGTGYRLSAQVLSASTQISASASFDVAVGPPARLTFVNQPIEAFAGHPFDLSVAISDAGGNVVPIGVSATLTLRLGPDTLDDVGLSCSGGLAAPVATTGSAAGRATFTGCVLTNEFANGEDVQLVATASGVSGGLALADGTSAGIQLQPGIEAPLSTLTLIPVATVVPWGQSGTFSVAFAGGGGRVVGIQRSAGGDDWVNIGQITTNSVGDATFAYRPRTSALYRAVFAGATGLPQGSSAARALSIKHVATQSPAHSTSTRITRGTTVTFSTTVRPVGTDLPRPTVSFYIYHLSSGAWKLVGTRAVTVSSAGVAKLAWRFGTTGEWYVRSRANGTSTPGSAVPTTLASSLTALARYTVR